MGDGRNRFAQDEFHVLLNGCKDGVGFDFDQNFVGLESVVEEPPISRFVPLEHLRVSATHTAPAPLEVSDSDLSGCGGLYDFQGVGVLLNDVIQLEYVTITITN